VLTRFAGLGDIRSIGSGNIGATNVLRTGRRGLALLTLLLDGGKGAVAVLLAAKFLPGTEAFAGLGALLGHIFPIWLKGKGGKGVATAIGIVLALSWQAGLLTIFVWLLIAFLFHYSSLAAIVAIGLLPLYALLLSRTDLLWLTVVILFIVIAKHGANIGRLLNHTETKIGEEKNAAPPA
jgi:glycerol-3-phosphate acyltransferase PlsY